MTQTTLLPPIELICPWDENCVQHTYPADWKFSGASGTDARADSRFMPDVYTYYDAEMHELYITTSLLCDEHALDYFTNVATWGRDWSPVYVTVRRHGERDERPLPWSYDKATDVLTSNAPR